jgi:D-3-phosphoglycerate dehydrogenase
MTTQRFTVVHTDVDADADLSVEEELLATIGAQIERTTAQDEDELAAVLCRADAVVDIVARISAPVAAAMERCQVVVRRGVGFDTLDVPALTRAGVIAVNLPDIWTEEVANHALMLMLAVNRRLPQYDRMVRNGGWRGFQQPSIGPVYGETAGIVGYGRIGAAFARRCISLGMRVLAYDPYKRAPLEPDTGAERVPTLNELLDQSDYVSLHCPLSEETFHMIGAAQLQRMRAHALLINTARGPVVDEEALIAALQSGGIAGAGIDAFEQEPPHRDSPLLQMDNVALTPHSAYYSDASAARAHRRVAEEIVGVLNGGWPANGLNPELKDHPRHAHRRPAAG